MKKKLISFIAIILVIASMSIITSTAITYECDVETHSSAVLVASLDSDDFVYERYVDKRRYASTMVELIDYLVILDEIDDLESKLTITGEILDDIPEPDGTLEQYEGKTLTVQNLLTIMMLTNGNDPAYVLANIIGEGKMSNFVTLMRAKLKELGCSRTSVITARPVVSTEQVTTCRDVYIILKELLKSDSFCEAASAVSFSLNGSEDDPEIVTENSVKRKGSPYYFSYVKQSKYGFDEVSDQNIASVGEYKDNAYAVIALGGLNDNETNAMTDTKQLLIWAFTKLDNIKIISEDTVVSSVKVESPFGEDSVKLKVEETVLRTVPVGYSNSDIGVKYEIPEKIELPIFAGQTVGRGIVTYKDEEINGFDLVVANSKGVSVVGDLSSAVKGMFNEMMPRKPEGVNETSMETIK